MGFQMRSYFDCYMMLSPKQFDFLCFKRRIANKEYQEKQD